LDPQIAATTLRISPYRFDAAVMSLKGGTLARHLVADRGTETGSAADVLRSLAEQGPRQGLVSSLGVVAT
jgi:hypothetical protein